MGDVFLGDSAPLDWDQQLKEVDALAARLGMKPRSSSYPTVLLHGEEGRTYSLFDVLHAILDQMSPPTIGDRHG